MRHSIGVKHLQTRAGFSAKKSPIYRNTIHRVFISLAAPINHLVESMMIFLATALAEKDKQRDSQNNTQPLSLHHQHMQSKCKFCILNMINSIRRWRNIKTQAYTNFFSVIICCACWEFSFRSVSRTKIKTFLDHAVLTWT